MFIGIKMWKRRNKLMCPYDQILDIHFFNIFVHYRCSHGASILFCLRVFFCPLFSVFQLFRVYLLLLYGEECFTGN